MPSLRSQIENASAEVVSALNRLKAERDACINRADTTGSELERIAQELEDRRQELTSFRRATFESVAATLTPLPEGRPPTYEQVLDVLEQPQTPVSRNRLSTGSNGSASTLSAPPSSTDPVAPAAERSATPPYWASNTPVSSPRWGSRNPYAAALAQRSLSS